MALEPVRLDDLTWEEMVLAIRRRIAAASSQQWTLHAAVDPGVTFLELYAWLLEQRLYWMDQVSPSMIRAALGLLGDAPRGTRSAKTVLKFQPSNDYEPVRRSTQVSLVKDSRIVFSTVTSMTRIPVNRVGLNIGGKDFEPDLRHGRPVPLCGSGDVGEIKITLWLKPLAANTRYPLSLLFELQTSSQIPSQWAAGAVRRVPPAATIKFLYTKDPSLPPVPFTWVHDGTSGLRRSGVVRLRIPEDWQPEGSDVDGYSPYSFWLRTDCEKFTSSPILKRLIPNVAIARHRRSVFERSLPVNWLPLAGNEIALAELPNFETDKDQPPIYPNVSLRFRERDKVWRRWNPTPDFAFHGPSDRVFVIDREKAVLRFGDGLTGRLPVPFTPPENSSEKHNVRICYQAGGGPTGNLGSDLEWEGVKSGKLKATNVVRAEGGTDAESAVAASERAGASIREITRAVTPDDYKHIARTTPGVAIRRAHAAIGYHPDFPCLPVPGAVTVFIVPDAPRDAAGEDDDELIAKVFVAAPVPDPGAFAAVRARLDKMRLVASEVFVRAPRYRPVGLTVVVEGDPVNPTSIRDRIRKRLANFLDPLVGGDRKTGWPFGEPLRPSVLLREAQRAIGKDGDVTEVAIRLLDDDNNVPESCSDVPIGEHDLVALDNLNVQLDRKAGISADQGGLR